MADTLNLSHDALRELARTIRKDVIVMTNIAASGHPGGPLYAADYTAALFSNYLRLRPQEHDIAMQLHGIILHSRRMIAIIAEQPERIRAARHFLVVQLPELAAISRAYIDNDGASHDNIVGDTPVENVQAMFDVLLEEGWY